MTRLVLVHGRDLDGHDPETLETQWLGALGAGLAAAGSSYRPHDADATFVYYGDTLEHLVGALPGEPPPVTVHAAGGDALPGLPDGELRFVLDVAREVLAAAGRADAAPVVAEGAVGDTLVRAVVAVLAAVDRHVPGLSAAVLLTLARDVHAYLHDDDVRRALDDGLAAALDGDEPAVVVAHSLGSVVAYSMLAARPAASPAASPGAPAMPLLLTLGSPLGIRAVREALRARSPLVFPPSVRRWVTVRDPGDLLALTDLTPETFPLPGDGRRVENLVVDNPVPGNHAAAAPRDGGWAGYLTVPSVAALVGAQVDAQAT